MQFKSKMSGSGANACIIALKILTSKLTSILPFIFKVLKDWLHTKFVTSMDFVDSLKMGDSIKNDVVDDRLQLSTLVEEETRDVIMDLLNQAKD